MLLSIDDCSRMISSSSWESCDSCFSTCATLLVVCSALLTKIRFPGTWYAWYLRAFKSLFLQVVRSTIVVRICNIIIKRSKILESPLNEDRRNTSLSMWSALPSQMLVEYAFQIYITWITTLLPVIVGIIGNKFGIWHTKQSYYHLLITLFFGCFKYSFLHISIIATRCHWPLISIGIHVISETSYTIHIKQLFFQSKLDISHSDRINTLHALLPPPWSTLKATFCFAHSAKQWLLQKVLWQSLQYLIVVVHDIIPGSLDTKVEVWLCGFD